MCKIYDKKEDIINHVCEEYRKYDTELNSQFFDFNVKLPEKEIIEAYAEIQLVINGDYVIRLEDPKLQSVDGDVIVYGNEVELIPDSTYDKIYEGNMKDYLERFNGKEIKSGIFRVLEPEDDIESSGAIKLDFIF